MVYCTLALNQFFFSFFFFGFPKGHCDRVFIRTCTHLLLSVLLLPQTTEALKKGYYITGIALTPMVYNFWSCFVFWSQHKAQHNIKLSTLSTNYKRISRNININEWFNCWWWTGISMGEILSWP